MYTDGWSDFKFVMTILLGGGGAIFFWLLRVRFGEVCGGVVATDGTGGVGSGTGCAGATAAVTRRRRLRVVRAGSDGSGDFTFSGLRRRNDRVALADSSGCGSGEGDFAFSTWRRDIFKGTMGGGSGVGDFDFSGVRRLELRVQMAGSVVAAASAPCTSDGAAAPLVALVGLSASRDSRLVLSSALSLSSGRSDDLEPAVSEISCEVPLKMRSTIGGLSRSLGGEGRFCRLLKSEMTSEGSSAIFRGASRFELTLIGFSNVRMTGAFFGLFSSEALFLCFLFSSTDLQAKQNET